MFKNVAISLSSFRLGVINLIDLRNSELNGFVATAASVGSYKTEKEKKWLIDLIRKGHSYKTYGTSK